MSLTTKPEPLTLKVVFTYHDNGQIYQQHYLDAQNIPHNPNGPAYLSWHDNGQSCCEEYRMNGQLHNPNGPAYRSWDENGQLHSEGYWLDGSRLTKEEFEQRLNKPSCAGRTVTIDGVEYELKPVKKS